MADNPRLRTALSILATASILGCETGRFESNGLIGLDPAFHEPPVPTVEENFIDTALTLKFPEPTEAEKQKAIERAAEDLVYEAAASERIIANASERKMRRGNARFRSSMLGGFVSCPSSHREQNLTSTRGERRRAQLGRA